MAEVLYTQPEDLKRKSSISGNIDPDVLLPFLWIAHDVHVKNLLGTDLHARLQAGITAGDLTTGTDSETSLIDDYIKPLTIHWGLVEAIPHIAMTISNKGIYRHTSENATAATKADVDSLVQYQRNIAQYYSKRFVDYMKYNQSSFAQYTSNTDDDIKPSKKTQFGGWEL